MRTKSETPEYCITVELRFAKLNSKLSSPPNSSPGGNVTNNSDAPGLRPQFVFFPLTIRIRPLSDEERCSLAMNNSEDQKM
ncbi:hypothetical protein CEXT_449291 [Caerostris extrusa]|uniref:Uncharacterized protein n=1 Tax=Caerostris extrusa TaxID=172846 RepID=A0AAV4UXR1_CAEEX|nr:hypothetical protein CEXT_449291 [Caerostris extrusa]